MEKKQGCLATILGLVTVFYLIYTPMYFIILNDEIDAVQEAPLIDFLAAKIRLQFEENAKRGMQNTRSEEFESNMDKLRDKIKQAIKIDIGVPFEKSTR